MALETLVQIRQMFDGMMAEVKKESSELIEKSIQSLELEELTPEQRVQVLHQASQDTFREIEGFEKLEYYCFADQEQLLLKIYSYRILCNERNEEKDIRHGFILFEKIKRSTHLLGKAKKQLPLFSFAHFLANQYNVVFYEMDEQPPGTTDKDYQDIRSWQINQKRICSQLECENLKENLIAESKTCTETDNLLQAEISQLENIYNNVSNWTPAQLQTEFSNLKGLTGILMPEDMERFHDLFCRSINGDKMNGMLSPLFFSRACQQINEKLISPPPIFICSFLMYFRWLGDVLKEKEVLTNERDYSLDYLFFETFNQGDELATIAIDKWRKKLKKHQITDEKYREELMVEYNKQREIFNELLYPDYFNYLEKRQKLKSCFMNDCLHSMNTEIPVRELKRAIVLNEMIVFLDDELRIANHNPFAAFTFQPFNRIQMAEIFCHLAPDSGQIKQLLKILTKSQAMAHMGRIPLYFTARELNHSFASLFKKALIKYKDVIGMMSISQRSYFLTEQLRDICYISRLNKIESNPINPYLKHLKHINKDELKSLQHQHPYKETEACRTLKKDKRVINQSVSFGYYAGAKPLKPILDTLQLRMNIFADGTTVCDFMEVISCKDLSKNKKIIYFGCKTNKVEYLRKKLTAWCTSFTPAIIGQSGIFVSWTEGPITANCLYNSKTILFEDSDLIDEIFEGRYPSSS